MRALVFAHVDEFGRFLNSPKRRFNHGSGSPTNVTTVRFVVAPGSTSSREHPVDRLNRRGDLPDYVLIAPFGEIRDALDQLLH